jgi:hypothetical protein
VNTNNKELQALLVQGNESTSNKIECLEEKLAGQREVNEELLINMRKAETKNKKLECLSQMTATRVPDQESMIPNDDCRTGLSSAREEHNDNFDCAPLSAINVGSSFSCSLVTSLPPLQDELSNKDFYSDTNTDANIDDLRKGMLPALPDAEKLKKINENGKKEQLQTWQQGAIPDRTGLSGQQQDEDAARDGGTALVNMNNGSKHHPLIRERLVAAVGKRTAASEEPDFNKRPKIDDEGKIQEPGKATSRPIILSTNPPRRRQQRKKMAGDKNVAAPSQDRLEFVPLNYQFEFAAVDGSHRPNVEASKEEKQPNL